MAQGKLRFLWSENGNHQVMSNTATRKSPRSRALPLAEYGRRQLIRQTLREVQRVANTAADWTNGAEFRVSFHAREGDATAAVWVNVKDRMTKSGYQVRIPLGLARHHVVERLREMVWSQREAVGRENCIWLCPPPGCLRRNHTLETESNEQ
jgi:hypothetical protein